MSRSLTAISLVLLAAVAARAGEDGAGPARGAPSPPATREAPTEVPETGAGDLHAPRGAPRPACPSPAPPEVLALLRDADALLREGRPAESAALAGAAAGVAKDDAVAAALYARAARDAAAAGDLAAALRWLDRRLGAAGRGGASEAVAEALFDLGDLHGRLGDHATAASWHRRALDLRREAGDGARVAEGLRRLARHLGRLGREGEALDRLAEAREICEDAGDEAGLVASLRVRGAVLGRAGRRAEARAALEEAVARGEGAGDEALLAAALLDLAGLEDVAGREEVALGLRTRALSIQERIGDARGATATLAALGRARARRGDAAGALALHREARRRARELSARDLLVETWWRTAEASLDGGDAPGAASAAARGVADLPRILGGLSEEQGAAARARHAGLFEVGGRAAFHLEEEALLFRFLEAGRAGTLLEFLADPEALREAAVPPDLLVAEEAARAEEARTLAAYRAALEEGSLRWTRRWKERLEAARQHRKAILERIQRHAKSQAGAEVREPPSLDRVRSWLAPDEVLVLYALHREDLVALVIGPLRVRALGLGDPTDVLDAVGALALDDAASDVEEPRALLRRRLLEPLALGPEVRRVIVCPDGALAHLPFAALDPEREFVYVPSATTWGVLREERHERGRGVLALGDPLYGTRPGPAVVGSVRSGVTLVPLPATREEALAVGDVVLLGADATEAGLRFSLRRRERWRAVHFACHGLADPERPTLSALALTSTLEDDGFLTALDVFRLRVPADLAVLSACDSGRGRVYRGEGLLGLVRAFLFSGTPRVLATLGEVDDEVTGVLMRRFYEGWRAGLPTARALREAQAFVRSHERWRHPHYWASWVLWGLGD